MKEQKLPPFVTEGKTLREKNSWDPSVKKGVYYLPHYRFVIINPGILNNCKLSKILMNSNLTIINYCMSTISTIIVIMHKS